MALPNPGMDFTPFDILTAAEMDDLVENDQALAAGTGFNAGAIPTAALADGAVTYPKLSLTTLPAFTVYPSATQVLTGAAPAAVLQFNTEQFDQASNYNNATYTFTCPATGIYEFVLFATGNNGAAARLTPFIKVGATLYQGTQIDDTFSTGTCYLLINLTAGDTVQPTATAGPGNITVSAGITSCRFSGKRIA